MHVGVCVKAIYDPSIISLNSHQDIDSGEKVFMVNPCDMVAVEEAVRLMETGISKSVTIVTIGPPEVEPLMRRCLALGATHAIRLWDDTFDQFSNSSNGILLAHISKNVSFDLILCGQKSADDEMGYTGYVLADTLKIPFIQNVVSIKLTKNNKFLITSKLESGNREIIETDFPVVLGISDNINKARYSKLSSLIDAFRTTIETYDLKRIDHPISRFKTEIDCIGFSPPRPRLKKLFKPDSNLSAADRLKQIMSGGIAEKKESIHEGGPAELSFKFCQYLDQIDL